MSCQNVGRANADIGGIGIQIAFAALAALSGVLLFVDWTFRKLEDDDTADSVKGSHNGDCRCSSCMLDCKRRLSSQLLTRISDVQTFNGKLPHSTNATLSHADSRACSDCQRVISSPRRYCLVPFASGLRDSCVKLVCTFLDGPCLRG